MADAVEGKQNEDSLPKSYLRVWNMMFEGKKERKEGRSWFQRRVDLFFEFLRNRRFYREFGYYPMHQFLYNSLRTHFFDKEVRL